MRLSVLVVWSFLALAVTLPVQAGFSIVIKSDGVRFIGPYGPPFTSESKFSCAIKDGKDIAADGTLQSRGWEFEAFSERYSHFELDTSTGLVTLGVAPLARGSQPYETVQWTVVQQGGQGQNLIAYRPDAPDDVFNILRIRLPFKTAPAPIAFTVTSGTAIFSGWCSIYN